ncbi:hypothetical protein TURU_068710 [Turdus rufiventris]|nr:hypothetical protein TURU_068710 [Turdus rufiventris]
MDERCWCGIWLNSLPQQAGGTSSASFKAGKMLLVVVWDCQSSAPCQPQQTCKRLVNFLIRIHVKIWHLHELQTQQVKDSCARPRAVSWLMLMPYTSLNSDFQAESSHISTDVSLLTLDMFFAFNLGPLPEYQGKSMELGAKGSTDSQQLGELKLIPVIIFSLAIGDYLASNKYSLLYCSGSTLTVNDVKLY